MAKVIAIGNNKGGVGKTTTAVNLDEYEKRMKDVHQKGTAKTRMKSFKIDNARIPFDTMIKIQRKDQNGMDFLQNMYNSCVMCWSCILLTKIYWWNIFRICKRI